MAHSWLKVVNILSPVTDAVSTAAGSEVSLIYAQDSLGLLSDAVAPATGSEVSLIKTP